MLEKLRRKSKDPSVNPYMRLIDPDLGMPNVFYMMDEIGRVQVLRKYLKEDDLISYCGTFEILYKTEKGGRFCLVMRRRPDEWAVRPEHRLVNDDMESLIIAEYYPGVMSRIYLKGLPEDTVKTIADDYVRRLIRKKKRSKLGFSGEIEK